MQPLWGMQPHRKRTVKRDVAIKTGYSAGLIGQISSLHSQFYFDLVGFGAVFEAIVASGLSDFVQRLEKPCNEVWYVEENGQFLASLALDGEDLGDGIAHLRWFNCRREPAWQRRWPDSFSAAR